MDNYSEWFTRQLASSAEGFVWAAAQVPVERLGLRPPRGLGEWAAVQHIFHLMYYEKTIALPSMRQWLGGSIPAVEDMDEEIAWKNVRDFQYLLPEFQQVRAEQIALLPRFSEADWQRKVAAVWGPVSLLWVVSKTYQHTAEHIHDVLRIALFWDAFAEREKRLS